MTEIANSLGEIKAAIAPTSGLPRKTVAEAKAEAARQEVDREEPAPKRIPTDRERRRAWAHQLIQEAGIDVHGKRRERLVKEVIPLLPADFNEAPTAAREYLAQLKEQQGTGKPVKFRLVEGGAKQRPEFTFRQLDAVLADLGVTFKKAEVEVQGEEAPITVNAACRRDIESRLKPGMTEEQVGQVARDVITGEIYAEHLEAVGGPTPEAEIPEEKPKEGRNEGGAAVAEPTPPAAEEPEQPKEPINAWYHSVALEAVEQGYTGDIEALADGLKKNFPDLKSLGNGPLSRDQREKEIKNKLGIKISQARIVASAASAVYEAESIKERHSAVEPPSPDLTEQDVALLTQKTDQELPSQ